MNRERISHFALLAGAWIMFSGIVGFLLSAPYLDSWKGRFAGALCLVIALADPVAIFLLRPAPIREHFSYYRPRFFAAWGLVLLSVTLFLIRDGLSLPVDKAGLPEDSIISRVRMLLLGLFLFSLFAGFLYRFWIGLEASSADSIHDQSVRSRFGSLTALQVIGFVLFLAVLNTAAAYRNGSADLTPGLYSYSEAARTVLKGVPRSVQVTAFLPVMQMVQDTGRRTTPGELYRISEELRVLLEQLTMINPKIQVRFLNADLLDPAQADFRGVTNGTILVRTYSEEAAASTPYAERRVTVSGEKDLDRFEKGLLEAIVQVSLPPSNVLFARSNGERTFGSGRMTPGGLDEWIQGLRFFNFSPLQAEAGTGLKIPDGTKALVLAGPTVPYSPEARRSILQYLRKGGGVFFMIDPSGSEDFAWLFEELRSAYRLQRGFLSQFADRPGLLMTDSLGDNPVTQSLRQTGRPAILVSGNAFLEKTAKPTAIKTPVPSPGQVPPTAPNPTSSPESREVAKGMAWKETDLLYSDGRTFHDRNRNGKKENGEESGRFALGVSWEGPGRVVAFSDVSWLTNGGLTFPVENANQRLAIDSLLWLSGEGEVPGIVVKERKDRSIQVSDALKLRNIVLGIFGFPILTGLGLALVTHFYRRRRSVEGSAT